MQTSLIVGLVIFNLLFFPMWIRFYFGSLGEFCSSFCSLLKPEWLSLLTGTYSKDYHSSRESGAFWGVSFIVVMLQLWVLSAK